jgi:hypothetical protein
MVLRRVAMLAVLMAGVVVSAAPVLAQGKKSDSVVKAKATADKPVDGKQLVKITLEIDKDYYLYANPVGNPDMLESQVTVTVTGEKKLESVKIEYPPGKVAKDVTGEYKKYTGKVTIKATVQRAKGDTGPLTVAIKLIACSDRACLFPATVKVPVK